jgi:hypothetical protein
VGIDGGKAVVSHHPLKRGITGETPHGLAKLANV